MRQIANQIPSGCGGTVQTQDRFYGKRKTRGVCGEIEEENVCGGAKPVAVVTN